MVSDPQDEIRSAVDKLRQSPSDENGEIRGCSDAKIQHIEQNEDVTLPEAYTAFLRQMGHSSGDFLRGDELFYPDMIGLTAGARELMDECGADTELTADDFAFAAHHGYVYLFFNTNAGDNPPVYRYVEDDDEPEQVFETFSAWLRSSVDDEIALSEY